MSKKKKTTPSKPAEKCAYCTSEKAAPAYGFDGLPAPGNCPSCVLDGGVLAMSVLMGMAMRPESPVPPESLARLMMMADDVRADGLAKAGRSDFGKGDDDRPYSELSRAIYEMGDMGPAPEEVANVLSTHSVRRGDGY